MNSEKTHLSYFDVLGVSEDVTQEELEERYQALAGYFTSKEIPAHLREWTRHQATLIDEAYAVLSDPERRAAARAVQQLAVEEPRDEPPVPEEPAEAPKAKDITRRDEESESKGRGAAAGTGFWGAVFSLRTHPIVLGAFIGTLMLGAVLFGRYGFPSGGSGSEAEIGPDDETLVVLDTVLIGELIGKLADDPQNPQVLFDLGETYFQAGEWQGAIDWFTKFLSVDPDNVHARTDIGTSNFNLGYLEAAEAAWLAVLDTDMNDVQAHYNLGFLYAYAEPPEMARAKQEWDYVIRLDPDSQLASIAQAHLDGLSEELDEGTQPDNTVEPSSGEEPSP